MRVTEAHPPPDVSASAAVAFTILRTTAVLGLLAVALALLAYVAMYTAAYAQPDTSIWYQALPPWMSFGGLLLIGIILLRQAALKLWACRAGTVFAWIVAVYAVAGQIAHAAAFPLSITGLCIAAAVAVSWAAVAGDPALRKGL